MCRLHCLPTFALGANAAVVERSVARRTVVSFAMIILLVVLVQLMELWASVDLLCVGLYFYL